MTTVKAIHKTLLQDGWLPYEAHSGWIHYAKNEGQPIPSLHLSLSPLFKGLAIIKRAAKRSIYDELLELYRIEGIACCNGALALPMPKLVALK